MLAHRWMTPWLLLLLAQACNCGLSPVAECPPNPCGACQAGCVADDVCVDGAWTCQCDCTPEDGGEDGGLEDGGFAEDAGLDGGDALDGGDLDGGAEPDGGSDGGSDGGVDGGVTPSDLCLDVAKKKCDYQIRCKTDDADDEGRTNDRVAAGERDKCIAREATSPSCVVGAEGWKLGRAVLDQAKYAACIDASYPSGTCARDLTSMVEKCTGLPFLTPATALGALCTHDSECVDGWCGAMTGACGACLPFLNADGGVTRCTRDSQCDPTRSYCPGADSNNPTSLGCQPYKGPGAACNQATYEAGQQEECGPDRVCSGTIVGGFTCTAPKLEGQACVRGRSECFRSGRGVKELTCATIAGTDVCVKLFNAAPGGQCGTGELTSLYPGPFCLETEFCSANSCFSRRGADAGCNGTAQCEFGLRCTAGAGNGRCVPYLDVDAGCTASGQCLNLLSCLGGKCAPSLSLVDGPCDGNVRCAEGYCGGDGGCRPLQADGQPCTADGQCQSYSCSTVCVDACWD